MVEPDKIKRSRLEESIIQNVKLHFENTDYVRICPGRNDVKNEKDTSVLQAQKLIIQELKRHKSYFPNFKQYLCG